ncbi:MAG: hypothetical protein ACTSPB_03490 [Candidatus Thorarchaeota archaeon]
MKCWIRACKFNENEECKKYKDGKELLEDFENGGGCALTWFVTGARFVSSHKALSNEEDKVSIKVEARILVNGRVVEDWTDLEMILEAIRGYYSLVCDSIVLEFRKY